MRFLAWLYDALVDLFHLVFAPWPDGEPDPAPGMPRWGHAVAARAFIIVKLALIKGLLERRIDYYAYNNKGQNQVGNHCPVGDAQRTF